ncbi:1-phosphatidylinositol-4-phosphate 5-kinase [Pelomyxa schiedti]|nr:1-phosphatidylinositol-4-phosphate 5-kinase [Pelomyxa schiedti]
MKGTASASGSSSYNERFLIPGSAGARGAAQARDAGALEASGDAELAVETYFAALESLSSALKNETWLGADAKDFITRKKSWCLERAQAILDSEKPPPVPPRPTGPLPTHNVAQRDSHTASQTTFSPGRSPTDYGMPVQCPSRVQNLQCSSPVQTLRSSDTQQLPPSFLAACTPPPPYHPQYTLQQPQPRPATMHLSAPLFAVPSSPVHVVAHQGPPFGSPLFVTPIGNSYEEILCPPRPLPEAQPPPLTPSMPPSEYPPETKPLISALFNGAHQLLQSAAQRRHTIHLTDLSSCTNPPATRQPPPSTANALATQQTPPSTEASSGVDPPLKLVKDSHVFMVITGIRDSIVTEKNGIPKPTFLTSYRTNLGHAPVSGPAHDFVKCTHNFDFYSYSGNIFRMLRNLSGLKDSDFLESFHFTTENRDISREGLCPLRSAGKSGSFFYGTPDMKYIIKTITDDEHNTLVCMLYDYHTHVNSNTESLLVRFYGLFWITYEDISMRFVVMENIFPPQKNLIQVRYDLKGSTEGRCASKKELSDPAPVLKDLDLFEAKTRLELGPVKRALLLQQIYKDCCFLEKHQIMDYSLLVGVHTCATTGCCILSRTEHPASAMSIFRQDEGGGFMSSMHDNSPSRVIYFIGIIDILQEYNIRKRAETKYRFFATHGSDGVSCVDPAYYSHRFQEFIGQALS